jgi:ribosomal protein S5
MEISELERAIRKAIEAAEQEMRNLPTGSKEKVTLGVRIDAFRDVLRFLDGDLGALD